MKAILYTEHGEEFSGEYLGEKWHLGDWWVRLALDEDGGFLFLPVRNLRGMITDQLEAVPGAGGPPSSDAAPQPSEPPEESSAPEGT